MVACKFLIPPANFALSYQIRQHQILFCDSNFDNTKFDVSTLNSIGLNSIPCSQIRLHQILCCAPISITLNSMPQSTSNSVTPNSVGHQLTLSYSKFYSIVLNSTDWQQNLSLRTQNCKSNNFKSWYPVRPGQLALVTHQITVDKTAEQQKMVLFIRQLLASLIREIENGNGRSDHLDSVAYRTDWLYNCLVRYLGVDDAISDQLVNLVRDARDLLDVLLHQNTASHSYRVEQVASGCRGRPN